MSKVKAIETVYNGHRFRSRLEARWAVFFDALGVGYEYEPEGFELPSGKKYLPDFRVQCHGKRGCRDSEPFDLYVEVKGRMTQRDAEKIREFACKHANEDHMFEVENPVLVVGNIPPKGRCWDSYAVNAYDSMNGTGVYPFNYELIDGDHFAAYPAAHDGKFYLWGDDGNYINDDDEGAVEGAYDKARKARFEFGETPRARSVLADG